jgi:pyruvate,water dikinase
MAVLFVGKDLLESNSDIFYLTVDEVFSMVQGTAMTQNLKALVELRKSEYAQFARHNPRDRIETNGIPYVNSIHGNEINNGTSRRLSGIGCSSGNVCGRANVVADPQNCDVSDDCILIAESTDPGWVFLMISSKGIVVEKGSVLSHTAIIGRELGIPTIVGVKNATKLIPNGAQISIDGSTGEIKWQ